MLACVWAFANDRTNQRSIIYTFSRWYNKLARAEVCIIIVTQQVHEREQFQQNMWVCVVDKIWMCTNFFCLPFALCSFSIRAVFFLLLIFVLSLHHAYKLLFVWHNMHAYIFCGGTWAWSAQHHNYNNSFVAPSQWNHLHNMVAYEASHHPKKYETMLMFQLLPLPLLIIMTTIVIIRTKALLSLVALDTLSLYLVGSVCCAIISICECECLHTIFAMSFANATI